VAILTLVVMLFYSATLALVALAAFLFYALVRWVSFSFQREAEEASIVTGAAEQSMLIESIRGIVTLAPFQREAARHAQWQSRLTDAVNADVALARIGIWQQSANTLIFGLETIVTVWLGVSFVMDGGFSVGMVCSRLSLTRRSFCSAALRLSTSRSPSACWVFTSSGYPTSRSRMKT
jgi:ATP-binding cassette subfamily B protein RaxB